jgi:hypothetical protein
MTQPQWTIPHDETHRFLKWGLMDADFNKWVEFFSSKNIPFEIGGGSDKWTIYKHQIFVDNMDRREHSNTEDGNGIRTRRCCVQQ